MQNTASPRIFRPARQRAARIGAVAASLSLLATACGGSSDEEAAPATTVAPVTPTVELDEVVLGLSTQNLERTFFLGLVAGAEERAAELGVEIVVVDGQDDVDVQGGAIDQLVADGVHALIVSPIDSSAAATQLEQAIADAIPVVAVANQIGSAEEFGPQFVYPGTVSLVTNDDVDMGRKAGLFVASTAGTEQVGVAVLAGKEGTANAVLRLEGFQSELEALGVDHEIVANIPGDWNADGGAAACTEFTTIAGVDLIFSMSDAMTAGCVEALDAAGMEMPIVSIGGNESGIGLLVDGRIVGSVCQKPATMGALAVDSALAAVVDGQRNQGLRFYETPVVTVDTLDQCDPQW